jgi:hypothetical protein
MPWRKESDHASRRPWVGAVAAPRLDLRQGKQPWAWEVRCVVQLDAQGASAQQLRRPRHPRANTAGVRATIRTIAKPFEWKFTRQDLNELLARLHESEPPLRLAA